MIIQVFAIRDSQVEAFLQPFFSPTKGAAMRSLSEAVNDPKHDFFKNAKDYSLWHLAEFDDSDGNIVPIGPIQHVVNCNELINKG